ncbi:hypothetical protein FA15DRAFT_659736 [Coprinopsis marcescibilis]|uniref:G domain-containing protein n=1 Tax=Coprinopsis marcescibilis TaxID=230819 RepID=A0A5C3KHX4_COPMA|nr:hypothetical protein FA15DRAFT_659736 [Coprinopsis marcescibilis]
MPNNIVIFGESGVGKSSVINLILGQPEAGISSAAKGYTLHAKPYLTNVFGHSLTLWDTAGLNEGDKGTVPDIKAVANLYNLLKNLEGGVSLLKGVPAVVIITHLEPEENSMDDWWARNQGSVHGYGIEPTTANHPTGVACITTVKGKFKRGGYQFDEEYAVSQQKARELIINAYSRDPWRVSPVEWFNTTITRVAETNCWGNVTHVREETRRVAGRGIGALATRWGVSEEEATNLVGALERN